MSPGIHEKLARVRMPRVHITYEVEEYGAQRSRELPFVLGVLSDFSGDPSRPLPVFSQRQFVEIDRDSFDGVLARMTPGLTLEVAAKVPDDAGRMSVVLAFHSLDDFAPARVAEQVPALAALLKARRELCDRLSGADSSEERALATIDCKISDQLNEVMHHPRFLQLEGTWRGLQRLVMNSETGDTQKIRVLNVCKRTLAHDLARAVEFDQSHLFKKVYEDEFGVAGGEPYAALIGDYEWTNHPDDIETLRLISNIAAAAFAPFLSAAGAAMAGLKSWTELAHTRDLPRIFDGHEFAEWRSFRASEDSRLISLIMPRVLARLPYGSVTNPINEFVYEETCGVVPMCHDHYCWSNAAYVMGEILIDAFAKAGFCVAIRGAEGGGRVEGLPMHEFSTDNADLDTKCPTEIGITDRLEFELSTQGLLPLCHYKNTDYAVFFGAQSVHKPKIYDRPEATANAAIAARLPYIMASGRFAHYVMILARDKVGSFMEPGDVERWLNRWISNYVSSSNDSAQTKARFPLREARIEVRETAGKTGFYDAIMYLRPWLRMEELATSLRIVARIPQKA